jgi:hypothetical protein
VDGKKKRPTFQTTGGRMKRLLFATTALLVMSWPALATTIDPLHGEVCSGAGTGCSNAETGGVTPIDLGTAGSFSFSSSPPNQIGDLKIILLVPDNEVGSLVLPSITGFASGSFGVAAGGADWLKTSNVDLLNFIFGAGAVGTNGSPANPVSGISTSLDPTALGFNAFIFDAGQTGAGGLMGTSDTTTAIDFSLGGNLPQGSVMLGFLLEGNGLYDTTALSGQLVVQPTVAVPGPIVGAGIPGFFALGMAWLARRRIRRRVA